MSAQEAGGCRVRIHLTEQATVEFRRDQLWPQQADEAGSGAGLEAFAEEVNRRLRADGFLGYLVAPDHVVTIPLAAIKRLDFTLS